MKRYEVKYKGAPPAPPELHHNLMHCSTFGRAKNHLQTLANVVEKSVRMKTGTTAINMIYESVLGLILKLEGDIMLWFQKEEFSSVTQVYLMRSISLLLIIIRTAAICINFCGHWASTIAAAASWGRSNAANAASLAALFAASVPFFLLWVPQGILDTSVKLLTI